MTLNYQFQYVLLYISGTVDHIMKILIMISIGVFLSIFFFQKCYILNIKIILFLLADFNSFFNNLFFKFINKCQKEIVRCPPLSSHVCDFLCIVPCFCFAFLCQIKFFSGCFRQIFRRQKKLSLVVLDGWSSYTVMVVWEFA